jgi:cytochrome oxidase assembly protein ShyY1
MARPFLLQTRWLIGHVIIAAVAVLMTVLGFWQLDRLDQRKERNADAEAAMNAQPLTMVPGVLTSEYTHVKLAGTWRTTGTRLVRYPLLDGQPGYYVVTPFNVAGQRDILVNRGWIPVDRGKTLAATAITTPEGFTSVEGYFRRAETVNKPEGKNEGDPPLPTVTGIDKPWIQATSTTDPLETKPLEGPDLTEGPHFSYALQWFSFCIIAVAGWFALLWRASRGD